MKDNNIFDWLSLKDTSVLVLPDDNLALTAQLAVLLPRLLREAQSLFTLNYESPSSEETKELAKKGSCGTNLLPLPQRLESPRKKNPTNCYFFNIAELTKQRVKRESVWTLIQLKQEGPSLLTEVDHHTFTSASAAKSCACLFLSTSLSTITQVKFTNYNN